MQVTPCYGMVNALLRIRIPLLRGYTLLYWLKISDDEQTMLYSEGLSIKLQAFVQKPKYHSWDSSKEKYSK